MNKQNKISQILKSPLLIFLLIGSGIFLLNSFYNKSSDIENDEIIINEALRNTIDKRFVNQWKREPTKEEREYLIEDYINKEIIYREAISLNLDKNDEIIKRRLQQKMEALMNDVNQISTEISLTELENYYKENIDDYSSPQRISWYQLAFEKESIEDAKSRLNYITSSNTLPTKNKIRGDIDIFPYFNADMTEHQVKSRFGGYIWKDISNAKLNTWLGPFESGFGYHLVYIINSTPSKSFPLEEVEQEVKRDLIENKSKDTKSKLIQELKNKYTITYIK